MRCSLGRWALEPVESGAEVVVLAREPVGPLLEFFTQMRLRLLGYVISQTSLDELD